MKDKSTIHSYMKYLNKKIRESIPDDRQHIANRNRDIGVYEALEWVLKSTPPKRTIFDLTKEELLELFYTAMPSQKKHNLIFCNYMQNKNVGYIEFQLRFDDGHLWIVHIYSDLSFFPYCEGICPTQKPAEYIDRIREMLNKSKEEVK